MVPQVGEEGVLYEHPVVADGLTIGQGPQTLNRLNPCPGRFNPQAGPADETPGFRMEICCSLVQFPFAAGAGVQVQVVAPQVASIQKPLGEHVAYGLRAVRCTFVRYIALAAFVAGTIRAIQVVQRPVQQRELFLQRNPWRRVTHYDFRHDLRHRLTHQVVAHVASPVQERCLLHEQEAIATRLLRVLAEHHLAFCQRVQRALERGVLTLATL